MNVNTTKSRKITQKDFSYVNQNMGGCISAGGGDTSETVFMVKMHFIQGKPVLN